MSIKRILFILLSLMLTQSVEAQMKSPRPENTQPSNFNPADFQPAINPTFGIPLKGRTLPTTNHFQRQSVVLTASQSHLRVKARSEEGLPLLIEGTLSEEQQDLLLEEQAYAYLEAAKSLLFIEQPRSEFVISKMNKDIEGEWHIRMQQQYRGIEVFGGQLILHTKNGVINALNGRYFKTPRINDLSSNLNAESATQKAYDDLRKQTNVYELSEQQKKYTAGQDLLPELVILHRGLTKGEPVLCWKVRAIPNVLESWDYFIDAHTGAVTHKVTNTCAFYPDALRKMNEYGTGELPPPGTSSGNDLQGNNVTLNIFQQGGTYYLIDASRQMFDNASSIPNDARGTIITVDAQSTNPANSNFDAVYIANSNNVWVDPKAISAHNNAGICYEYYRQTHNRNSINGNGGNIISFINVSETDGNGMDNAFWNGQAMFYGNGNQAFSAPLQRALDVSGHEMTHGVIQTAAGLIYEGQSGAINESMADVFGHLMEPEDWQMGEDVVNTGIFSSGALRDLSNPNQGGSGLNDAGWQPAHMNQYQNLPNTPEGDNGGVHVNSGIPNKAFYLFSNAVGSAKAGQIYYHALSNNLTANAQFIDLRLAIIQSANQLYGTSEANAAASAFDQVGIVGDTGSGTPGDYESNPGQDFIVLTDAEKSALYYYDNGSVYGLTSDPILSRPSVTDDGAFILYVAADNTIRVLSYDANNATYTESYLENNPQTIWRNVAISKDGSKLAALTTDYDNNIFIYDFNTGAGQNIAVRNSTSQQGVYTNDLQYVDFIEWDLVGEEILFDAYNVLDDDFGNTSDYWDVGLIRAWDNTFNTFGDGFVFKIFSGLPENTSVGNPTFSKNSPYIIALDFIDDQGNYSILGVNLEEGNVGTIFENAILGYPNYSIDDSGLIFDAHDNSGAQVLGYIPLASDKITPGNGDAQILIDGGKWGVWYGLGERDLTGVDNAGSKALPVTVFPNPTSGISKLQMTIQQAEKATIFVLDLTGKLLHKQKENLLVGQNEISLDLSDLMAGFYIVKIESEYHPAAFLKISKQ